MTSESNQSDPRIAITVDGVEYAVREGQNLLHAVLSHRLDLPYFCWHPAMGSVGACRQCAVISYANEEDTRGRLEMACMTNVSDGMRISIADPTAASFRETVIEWLMENHPHDCPVCEEGGECHLQDMTVMTGHSVRRYRGKKRTWKNQDLGPFIGHEMNRCITCYRCVRFYNDYAGGTDLGAFGSRGRMYFGRVEDGILDNEFSGNLVEVCPTGVFTDKPFAKTYTRKWDLQTAPSICSGCSVGCNIFPSERYGEIKRIQNRYNGTLNGYFICDRGRFGSHYINSEQRIRRSGVRAEDGIFELRGSATAVERSAASINGATIGIGSPRASFESNYALKKLVGHENFCAGMSDVDQAATQAALDVYQRRGARVPTLADVEKSDAVLVVGEDLLNTAPRVALAIRQALRSESLAMAAQAGIPLWQDAGVRGHAQHHTSPLFLATSSATRLDGEATMLSSGSPTQLSGIAKSIAGRISDEYGGGEVGEFETAAADALLAADNPLIVSGTSLGSSELIHAVANIAWALQHAGKTASLLLVGREANSMGCALLGGGLSMSEALDRMSKGSPTVVVENDLYRRAEHGAVDAALSSATVTAIDVLENATAERADIVFPAASYAESTGTYVNYETRAQRFYQVFQPEDEVEPSWRWIVHLAAEGGQSQCSWQTIDELIDDAADGSFACIRDAGPDADFRLKSTTRIPRQTHRYSGRTAMHAHESVHEPKTAVDSETPLSFSMEGQNPGDYDDANAPLPYSWSPGWNSNQSIFKFQDEVGGELSTGDSGRRIIDFVDIQTVAPTSDDEVAAAPNIADDEFQPVPAWQLFGSDEHSASSPPIAERMPAAFVVFAPSGAKQLGVSPGDGVTSSSLVGSFEVRVDERVPERLVCISAGLPETPFPIQSSLTFERNPDFVRRGGDRSVIARG